MNTLHMTMAASKNAYMGLYDSFAAGRIIKAPTYVPAPGEDEVYDLAELLSDEQYIEVDGYEKNTLEVFGTESMRSKCWSLRTDFL